MYSSFDSFGNIISLLSSFLFLVGLMFFCGVGFVNWFLPVRLRNFKWILYPVFGWCAWLFVGVKLNTFWWGLSYITWPCILILAVLGIISIFGKKVEKEDEKVFSGPTAKQTMAVFSLALFSSLIYLTPALFLGDKGIFGLGGGDFSYYMGIGDKLQDRPFLRYYPTGIYNSFGSDSPYRQEYRHDPEEWRTPPRPGWAAEQILWLNHHYWSCPAGWVVLPGMVQALSIADRLTSYTLVLALLPFFLSLILYCFCRVVFGLDHGLSMGGCLLTSLSPALTWALYAHFYPHFLSLFVPMLLLLVLWKCEKIEYRTIVSGALTFFVIWSIYPYTLQMHALALLPIFLVQIWKKGQWRQRLNTFFAISTSTLLIVILGFLVSEMASNISLNRYSELVINAGVSDGMKVRTEPTGIPVPMKWWAFYTVGAGVVDPTLMYTWNYTPIARQLFWFEPGMQLYTILSLFLILAGAWFSGSRRFLITVISIYLLLFCLSQTLLYLKPYMLLKAFLYLTPYYFSAIGVGLVVLLRRVKLTWNKEKLVENRPGPSVLRMRFGSICLLIPFLAVAFSACVYRGYFTYRVVTGTDHTFLQLDASREFSEILQKIQSYAPLGSKKIGVFYDQYLNLPAMDMLLHKVPFESLRVYDYIGGRGKYDPADMVSPDEPLLIAIDKQVPDITTLTDEKPIWQNQRWTIFKTGDDQLRQGLIGGWWNDVQFYGPKHSNRRIYRYIKDSVWFGIWSPQEQDIWLETHIGVTGDKNASLELYLNPPIGITGAKNLPSNKEELDQKYGPGTLTKILIPSINHQNADDLVKHTPFRLRKGFNRILLTPVQGKKRGRDASWPIAFWIDAVKFNSRPVLEYIPNNKKYLVDSNGDAGHGKLWSADSQLPSLKVTGWLNKGSFTDFQSTKVKIFTEGGDLLGENELSWQNNRFYSEIVFQQQVANTLQWENDKNHRYLNLKIKIVSSQDMVGKELSAFEVDNVFVKNGSTNVEAERKKYRRQVKGGFNEKLVRYWEQLHGASPKPLDELSD